MSYWVYLQDAKGETLDVGRHSEGGTYAIGGTSEACLNVTYNYAMHFREAWETAGGAFDGDGSGTLGKMLGGKRATDVLAALEKAVQILGTERSGDYWKPSEGNAGYALSILLAWARQHPEGVFEVH